MTQTFIDQTGSCSAWHSHFLLAILNTHLPCISEKALGHDYTDTPWWISSIPMGFRAHKSLGLREASFELTHSICQFLGRRFCQGRIVQALHILGSHSGYEGVHLRGRHCLGQNLENQKEIIDLLDNHWVVQSWSDSFIWEQPLGSKNHQIQQTEIPANQEIQYVVNGFISSAYIPMLKTYHVLNEAEICSNSMISRFTGQSSDFSESSYGQSQQIPPSMLHNLLTISP